MTDNLDTFDFGTGIKVKVVIYNNPKLKWDTKTTTLIEAKKDANSYFEKEQYGQFFN